NTHWWSCGGGESAGTLAVGQVEVSSACVPWLTAVGQGGSGLAPDAGAQLGNAFVPGIAPGPRPQIGKWKSAITFAASSTAVVPGGRGGVVDVRDEEVVRRAAVNVPTWRSRGGIGRPSHADHRLPEHVTAEPDAQGCVRTRRLVERRDVPLAVLGRVYRGVHA